MHSFIEGCSQKCILTIHCVHLAKCGFLHVEISFLQETWLSLSAKISFHRKLQLY